jgi:hypothetical protein
MIKQRKIDDAQHIKEDHMFKRKKIKPDHMYNSEVCQKKSDKFSPVSLAVHILGHDTENY